MTSCLITFLVSSNSSKETLFRSSSSNYLLQTGQICYCEIWTVLCMHLRHIVWQQGNSTGDIRSPRQIRH